MLEEVVNGEVIYVGEPRKSILVKERMTVEEMRRMVIGSDLVEYKVWYSLKYNKQILINVKWNMDVKMISREIMNMAIYV